MTTVLSVLIAAVCGASAAEPTPADYARLNHALDWYYAGVDDATTEWGVPGSWRFEGYGALGMVLGHVLKHADDIGPKASRRTLDLLAWSLELVTSADAEPEPFARALVRSRLNALFRKYRHAPERRAAVTALLDATDLWNSAQVRYLAERAGDLDSAGAEFHAEVLMRLTPWTDVDARAIANTIRRRPPPLRSLEQWALLILTGLANQAESARVLLDAAHAFASWPTPEKWSADDHPLRAAIEFLFAAHDPDEGAVNLAFARARALSEKERDRRTPLAWRRRFFDEFHDVPLVPDVAARERDPKLVVERRVYARARPEHPRRGNVYYPTFGRRGCTQWLTGRSQP